MFLDLFSKRNIRNRTTSLWALVFIVLDILFTLYWVEKYGIEIEGNPFGKIILSSYFGIILKVLISFLCLYFINMKIHNSDKFSVYFILNYTLFTIYLLLLLYHIVLFIYDQLITQGVV